jgi:hypothetical protein
MTAELVYSELFDCEVVDGKGIVGNEHPLNEYYAYGIKNSFEMNLIL